MISRLQLRCFSHHSWHCLAIFSSRYRIPQAEQVNSLLKSASSSFFSFEECMCISAIVCILYSKNGPPSKPTLAARPFFIFHNHNHMCHLLSCVHGRTLCTFFLPLVCSSRYTHTHTSHLHSCVHDHTLCKH